jgi:hypothetical protein
MGNVKTGFSLLGGAQSSATVQHTFNFATLILVPSKISPTHVKHMLIS